MRAIRPAARCAPPRAPTRLLATGASKGRKPSGAAPAAGARRGQAPQMPYATPNSAASPIPMPTLPVRSPGDELMARFSQNTEKEDPLPLVSSREEFGKRYLFELITMPIRTPGASFQAMVDSFDDDVARTFFMDRPLNKENAKLYISLLGETKRVDRMFKFLQEMRKEGLEISKSVYITAISACGPAHRYTDALQLEQEMIQAGMAPDDRVRGAIISVLAKSGQFEAALGRLKEINVFLNPEQKTIARLAYTSIIDGYVRHKMFDRAWETFDYMRTYVSEPDAVTYTIMIQACAATGQAERALGFYEEMRQKNVQLTEYTFDSLIHACARRLEFLEEAFLMYQSMKAVGFVASRSTYQNLLLAAANGGDLARMKALVREMEEEKIPFDAQMRATQIKCYTRAMKGKSTIVITDYLAEIEKLFEQGLKETPKPELPFFNTMLVALATSLRPKKVLPFFETMTEKYGVKPDAYSYSAIIQLWLRRRLFKAAQEWLAKMLEAGFQPNKQLYLVFIDTTVRAGLTNLSLTFLRAMVTKLGIKPKKEEVESLWRKGIEDVGVRRELEMCVEPRRYVRPHRRPDVGGANYESSAKFLPRGVRLPSPEQKQAIATREERSTKRLPSP